MPKLQILVGSVFGTAEGVAEHLKKSLDRAWSVTVNTQPDTDDLTRDPDELLVFCTSNTGAGDLPENLAPLHVALVNTPPNIAGRRYALINLGDSSYPTFGEAGALLDAALQDIGASPLAEPLLIDTSVERYPQKIALEWLEETLAAQTRA